MCTRPVPLTPSNTQVQLPSCPGAGAPAPPHTPHPSLSDVKYDAVQCGNIETGRKLCVIQQSNVSRHVSKVLNVNNRLHDTELVERGILNYFLLCIWQSYKTFNTICNKHWLLFYSLVFHKVAKHFTELLICKIYRIVMKYYLKSLAPSSSRQYIDQIIYNLHNLHKLQYIDLIIYNQSISI